jgi:hypothetical protein
MLYLWVKQNLSMTMKKLLVLLLVVGFAVQANAQVQVALGLKAGVNISKFDAEGAENYTGIHGGAFALFKLTKIGIQPELLFSQQGMKFKNVTTETYKTSYVNIPVMIKLYLVAGLNIQAGPQFGFLTAADAKADGDFKDKLKSSDISANIGLGWDLPFGLMIDARYNLGLSDVSDSPEYDDLKSRVIQVSVGYKIFKIGK